MAALAPDGDRPAPTAGAQRRAAKARLSWTARNGRAASRGRKLRTAVAGKRSGPQALPFGDTAHRQRPNTCEPSPRKQVIGHNQWRVIGETMRERSPKQHLDTEAMNGRHRDRLRWDHIVRAIVGDFLVPRAEPVL